MKMNPDQERMLFGFVLLLAIGILAALITLRPHFLDELMKLSPDRLRMAYGFMILTVLSVLATVVALGKVEQQTSYGLMPIITSLATLAGAFAQWAFGPPRDGPPPPDQGKL
jgi:hypothetical protein